MTRTRKPTTRLSIEALESRLTPAGNVTAQMVPNPRFGGPNTFLVIEGDNEANEIRVIEDAPNHVRIEGVGDTTVNGKAAEDLYSSSGFFINDAEVYLGNGSDTLSYELTGGQSAHYIAIDTGTGGDSVSVHASGNVGGLSIDTGQGNDDLAFGIAPFTLFEGVTRVNTGLGDDTVLLHTEESGFFNQFFFTIIETGAGNDTVRFEGQFAGYDMWYFDLGAGDDTVIGGSGHNYYFPVVFLGGAGHDTVLNASYFYPYSTFHDFETIEG